MRIVRACVLQGKEVEGRVGGCLFTPVYLRKLGCIFPGKKLVMQRPDHQDLLVQKVAMLRM